MRAFSLVLWGVNASFANLMKIIYLMPLFGAMT
jgi:hypothetical protein